MYIKLTKNIINELIISENVNINLINNIIKSKLNYDKFNLILETEYNYSWVNITNKILWCLIKDKNYNYHNNVKFLFIINIKNNNEIKIYKFFDNIKIRFINVNNPTVKDEEDPVPDLAGKSDIT